MFALDKMLNERNLLLLYFVLMESISVLYNGDNIVMWKGAAVPTYGAQIVKAPQ